MEADWITAIPHSSCNSPTGTHVVSPQEEALVTIIGGGCTYDGWSFFWLVGHHAICDAQNWTGVI